MYWNVKKIISKSFQIYRPPKSCFACSLLVQSHHSTIMYYIWDAEYSIEYNNSCEGLYPWKDFFFHSLSCHAPQNVSPENLGLRGWAGGIHRLLSHWHNNQLSLIQGTGDHMLAKLTKKQNINFFMSRVLFRALTPVGIWSLSWQTLGKFSTSFPAPTKIPPSWMTFGRNV